ncbi:MAG: GtrA family protein [Helicobacteraceae bacterium]|nr:GtrA family protein [Helicobacteraceae bacterium]
MIKKQIIKFIIVGMVNTVIYYMLFSSLIYFNFDYRLAVLFATLVGLLFSFKTFSKYVFENNNNKLLYRFASVYVLLYIVNIALIALLQPSVLNYYLSGLFATICCAILSFVLNKFYVFKK